MRRKAKKRKDSLVTHKSVAWTIFRSMIIRPRKKKQRREVEGHHTMPNISVHGTASVSEAS